MTTQTKYIWNGINWLHGVPARDLTVAEWKALTKEQRDILEPAYIQQPQPQLTSTRRRKSAAAEDKTPQE